MIFLAHADGKLPNLALMKLSSYFKQRGESVRLIRPSDERLQLFDNGPVYGSSIFTFSVKERARIDAEWGRKSAPVIWGGTGVDKPLCKKSSLDSIDKNEDWNELALDYSIYPDFQASIGFTQRGCRMECPFCVVPEKEGKVKSVGTLRSIWRGNNHPKRVILLDNDFFGQPEWPGIIAEAREMKLRICLMQGINVRAIKTAEALALKSIEYRNAKFTRRRLYTAWDNFGDESVFKKGVARLARAGIPPEHLLVYMLVGYDPEETWDRLWYRFAELVNLGCLPYPMVYNREERPDLCAFQRWTLRGLYRAVPWPEYRPSKKLAALIPAEARSKSDASWRRVVNRLLGDG